MSSLIWCLSSHRSICKQNSVRVRLQASIVVKKNVRISLFFNYGWVCAKKNCWRHHLCHTAKNVRLSFWILLVTTVQLERFCRQSIVQKHSVNHLHWSIIRLVHHLQSIMHPVNHLRSIIHSVNHSLSRSIMQSIIHSVNQSSLVNYHYHTSHLVIHLIVVQVV